MEEVDEGKEIEVTENSYPHKTRPLNFGMP